MRLKTQISPSTITLLQRYERSYELKSAIKTSLLYRQAWKTIFGKCILDAISNGTHIDEINKTIIEAAQDNRGEVIKLIGGNVLSQIENYVSTTR